MNDVLPFLFDGDKLVRAVMVDGKPHFVGRDVAERLSYADATNAMKQHCKGVVKRHPLRTPGGIQKVRVLDAADVLRLIVGSTLPEAVRFERWVFEEVLPSILRRNGPEVPAARGQVIDPSPALEEPEPPRVRLVTEARLTFGVRAAAQLWFRLGLPVVPAMLRDPRQGDLLAYDRIGPPAGDAG